MKRQQELMQEYLDELSKKNDEKWVDYYKKETARVYKTADGDLIPIKKPQIETSFCFGYSLSRYDSESYDNANDMVHYASTKEDYFLKENRKQVETIINRLENKEDSTRWYFYLLKQEYKGERIYKVEYLRDYDLYDLTETEKARYKPLKEHDRLALIEEYKKVLVDFEKRLQAYLKRYGLSKLNIWSYWQDA